MGTVFMEGSIVGHASPKWKNPNKKDKKILNKKLSIGRANEVETFVHELFQRKMREQGIDVAFALECTNERDFTAISIPTEGMGDMVTLKESGGNPNANDESLRRTDINIALTHQMEAEAGMSVKVLIPEECEDHATNKWAIKISLSGGAHLAVGGAFAIGQIKNRKTGQIAQGIFKGAGIGVGLQSPGADPGWSDWVNFTTDQIITFDHFQGTLCRLTTAGAGFLIGYSLAYISFPMYGANSISVGGFSLGAVGADAGSNVGNWKFSGSPPGPRCVPEHFESEQEMIPYTYDIKDALKHSVFFDTGSDEISNSELERLELFISEIVDTIIF